MILSTKTTLISIIFTILAVFICCLFMILFTKQNTADNIINTGVVDYQRFSSQFQINFFYGYDDYKNMTENTKRSYILYKFKECSDSTEYTLQKNNDIFINNTGIDPQPYLNNKTAGVSIKDESDSGPSYMVTEIRNKTYLIVGQTWQVNEEEYFLSLIRDVSAVMNNVEKLIIKCVITCGVVIIIAAILLSYFIYKSLKPLKSLSKNAGKIASGAYNSRIEISGQDEVAELASKFNDMASAIEKHVSEVEATSEERMVLLSALSHEMKTPVTAITGYCYALIHSKLTDEQKQEAIYFIDNESKRLERLSSKLSQLISLNGKDLSLTEISCDSIMCELDCILSPIAKSCGIILSIQNKEKTIKVERDLIICLATNLFDNARKAGAKNITIYCDETLLKVTDNGKGIPNDQIEKITKPFYTLNKSRSGESFGLGLAIALRIAELHHAKLVIESRENMGTTVKLVLA